MQRVIVTVERRGEQRDLEVPAEIEITQLSKMIAQALHWDSTPAGQSYKIIAKPSGKVLSPYESLAEAGIWDGAWLVFQLFGEEPSSISSTPVTPPVSAAPAIGWKPLDIDMPIEAEKEQSGTISSPTPAMPVAADTPVIGWKPLDIDTPTETEKDQQEPDSEITNFVWKSLD